MAAFGRPSTPALRGSRCSTGSRSRLSERWKLRRPIPTSFTQGRESRTFARRSARETASISPPTGDRRGRTSDCTTRGRSAASSSIHAILTSFTSVRWATLMGPTMSEASSSQRTGEILGSACWMKGRRSESPISLLRRRLRTSYSPVHGIRIVHRGAPMLLCQVLAAESTARSTAEPPGRSCPATGYQMATGAASAWHLRRMASVSMR